MARFPWLRLGKKTDPEAPLEPPIWFGDHSNGEYFHRQTPREARMRHEILRRADEQARYLGMDRREFLASSMGMAVTLAVINQAGCGDDDGGGGGSGDGPFVVPQEATCEESDFVSGDEFIFDIQTHSFDDGEWRQRNIVYPIFLSVFANCDDRVNQLDCYDQDKYGEAMFVDSETTLSVISAWPAATCSEERQLFGRPPRACGLPLSNDGMRQLRDWLNSKAMSQRVVNQVQVMPNDQLDLQLDIMRMAAEDKEWGAVSWKCYPGWRSDSYPSPEGYARGFFLTDPIGRKFIETGLDLGVPNFSVHKGLPIPGFDVEHNAPTDIGPIALDYPEANFIVYHSGINSGTGENVLDAVSPPETEDVPFDPNDPDPKGVNMLIKNLMDHGIEPGSNVYAELGSAWSNVARDPNSSQHMMGKLLKYVGEDNVVWGTDAIITGGPQWQIEAFRAFQITEEYQEQFGYPPMTDEIKRKIFGLNAARIFRIDPEMERCKLDSTDFAMIKKNMDGELGPRRWTAKPPLGPTSRREFLRLAKLNIAKGVPG
jgi:predicted TIM-barrel fold metal-dependent hydrolase